MVKKVNIIFISLVFIILMLPCLSMMSGLEPSVSITENRRLSTFAGTDFSLRSILKYPKTFSTYFDDNYGFRKFFSHLHLKLMVKGLEVPIIKEMIIGQGNWIFWGGDHIIERYRSPHPLGVDELDRLTRIHRKQYQYCSEKGIPYLFVTPPNKFTVYPEYLPDFLKTKNKRVSHSDQLFAYLEEHTEIDLVNLKDPLLNAKKDGKIYFESDSHWNDMGAFYGYREIMKKICEWFPQITAYTLDDFTFGEATKKDAELANILGLSDHLHETYKTLIPKIAYTWKRNDDRDSFYKENDLLFPKTMCVTNHENGSGGTAVMFIDSFSFAMAPLFNQHFSKVIYVYKVLGYNNFDMRIIDHEKPDIVICEIGERFFLKIP